MAHVEEYREEHSVTELPQRREEKGTSYRLAERVIYYILGVIEVLLGSSFALQALGANAASPFVQFINAVSSPFAAPFRSIFGTSVAGAGSVFEWSLVIAMVVYLVVALGLVKLFKLIIEGGSRDLDQVA